MEIIKKKLEEILEHANSDKPACKDCVSYRNGGCSFGCVNEKLRLTSKNYSCDNFSRVYDYDEDTLEAMKNILGDIYRIEESKKDLELLLSGKITETDFINLVG